MRIRAEERPGRDLDLLHEEIGQAASLAGLAQKGPTAELDQTEQATGGLAQGGSIPIDPSRSQSGPAGDGDAQSLRVLRPDRGPELVRRGIDHVLRSHAPARGCDQTDLLSGLDARSESATVVLLLADDETFARQRDGDAELVAGYARTQADPEEDAELRRVSLRAHRYLDEW